jgi:hypothetical protein
LIWWMFPSSSFSFGSFARSSIGVDAVSLMLP